MRRAARLEKRRLPDEQRPAALLGLPYQARSEFEATQGRRAQAGPGRKVPRLPCRAHVRPESPAREARSAALRLVPQGRGLSLRQVAQGLLGREGGLPRLPRSPRFTEEGSVQRRFAPALRRWRLRLLPQARRKSPRAAGTLGKDRRAVCGLPLGFRRALPE